MTSPDQIAYIAIGSNIDPEANLRRAVDLLRAQCQVLALSSVYQSPPYGFTEQPDFLDVTVKIRTTLSPLELKTQVLNRIEKACGRDRAAQLNPHGPLALDMDILLWGENGGTAFEYGEKPWRVPNKGITQFAAVAIPLAELAPHALHPTEGVTIAEIAARFADAANVKRLGFAL